MPYSEPFTEEPEPLIRPRCLDYTSANNNSYRDRAQRLCSKGNVAILNRTKHIQRTGTSILDFSCGTGLLLETYCFKYTSVDGAWHPVPSTRRPAFSDRRSHLPPAGPTHGSPYSLTPALHLHSDVSPPGSNPAIWNSALSQV